MLKHKRKRETFIHRIESLLELPREVVTKYSESLFTENFSLPLLLEKCEKESTNKHLEINLDPDEKINSTVNAAEDLENNVSALKEEIDEIMNELELFARKNRKNKMINLMERIAENIDDSLFDIEELTDFVFFGNKQTNIENEYLETQRKKYVNNIKLVEYTNKLLMNDDDVYFSKMNSNNFNNEPLSKEEGVDSNIVKKVIKRKKHKFNI